METYRSSEIPWGQLTDEMLLEEQKISYRQSLERKLQILEKWESLESLATLGSIAVTVVGVLSGHTEPAVAGGFGIIFSSLVWCDTSSDISLVQRQLQSIIPF